MNNPSSRSILYGTSACHLCELAEQLLLSQSGEGGQAIFEKVDISGSDTLFERYGLRIPVLKHPGGGELDWPFSLEELQDFLAQEGL